MPDMRTLLDRIRHGISDGAYPNEAAVGSQIVLPLLRALSWDVTDPSFVRHQFPLPLKDTTRYVDLALCVSGSNPRYIIELKAIGKVLRATRGLGSERQMFEYAFHAGAPLALLTNGAEWRFYSAQSAGTYDERLVCAFNLVNDEHERIVNDLERYLSYANVKSGHAADFAREDLRIRHGQQEAKKAIPAAWDQLRTGDVNDRLVALVSETTAALAQGEPRREDVAEFLRGLAPSKRPPRPVVLKPKLEAIGPREPRRGDRKTSSSDGSGSVRYMLLGEERRAKTLTEVYVKVFRALAERDSGFLDRVEPRLRGKKNRVVARTRDALAEVPRMRSTAVQLPRDWWLLTWFGSKMKLRKLRIACEVAGIPFDDRSGLKIDLPSD